MANRINSGGSNNLNCIKIDPRTGEKLSFNVDVVAAAAWQHPQQCTFIHARDSFHVSSNESDCYITSLPTNQIGRYLKGKCKWLEVTATDISQPIRSRTGSHFLSTTSDNVSLYTQTQARFLLTFISHI